MVPATNGADPSSYLAADGTWKPASYTKEETYTKAEVDALIQQAKEAIYAGLQNSLSINEKGELVLDLPDEV